MIRPVPETPTHVDGVALTEAQWTAASYAPAPWSVSSEPESAGAVGSSHVNVMFSSESPGSAKARRIASVKRRYPSGPGATSKEYVRPSKLTFMTAGAAAAPAGASAPFQLGRSASQNSQ